MEYRIVLTVQTDVMPPAQWPDESIEVGAFVSVLLGTGDEILGRVVRIRCERVEV